MRALPPRELDLARRWVTRVAPDPYLRFATNDYSFDPRLVERRVEVRASQREITAVALDTGELTHLPQSGRYWQTSLRGALGHAQAQVRLSAKPLFYNGILGRLGAIAQLGERLLCKQEVAGSIPAGSIEKRPANRWFPMRSSVGDIGQRGSSLA